MKGRDFRLLVADGKLYIGSALSAGAVTRITMDEDRRLSSWGKSGCPELYTFGSAIKRTWGPERFCFDHFWNRYSQRTTHGNIL